MSSKLLLCRSPEFYGKSPTLASIYRGPFTSDVNKDSWLRWNAYWATLQEHSSICNGINKTTPLKLFLSNIKNRFSAHRAWIRFSQSEKLVSATVWVHGCHISSHTLLHQISQATNTKTDPADISIKRHRCWIPVWHQTAWKRHERDIIPSGHSLLSGITKTKAVCCIIKAALHVQAGILKRENAPLTDWHSNSPISEARSRGMQQLRQLCLPGRTGRSRSSQMLIVQSSQAETPSQKM